MNSDHLGSSNFLERIENIRSLAHQNIDINKQTNLGQFFTPLKTASMMANMFSSSYESIHLLDAGAGTGILTATYIDHMMKFRPKRIHVTAFEVDSSLIPILQMTLRECNIVCSKQGIEFQSDIRRENFIEAASNVISSQNSFFPQETPSFNAIIMNPPYRKINNQSREKQCLNLVNIETTNLYSAFLWLAIHLLSDNGELVAIVPRSFCNGAYYKNFRSFFLKSMSIRRIHIFRSRNLTFREDNVLQENIIIHAIKTPAKPDNVTISTSAGPDEEDLQLFQMHYEDLVHPNDPDQFIRIISDELDQQFQVKMRGFHTTLHDLGLSISTGKVVDFRSREFITENPDEKNVVPLIYPNSLQNGYVNWPPLRGKKPVFLLPHKNIDQLTIPAEVYVFIKRFSSNEEKRRVIAAIFDPMNVKAKKIGVENHINYIYTTYGKFPQDVAKGLVLYFNSTFFDQYFRQLSGHTQVNVTDLRNVKYPTRLQLTQLGKRITDNFPDQETIDQIVAEELNLNEQSSGSKAFDPIQVKKRIGEALSILQALNVPREQQNERSALSLLALLNLTPKSPWKDATSVELGITEMMDFFRAFYGKNYAPNTRETVRRYTIHQFMQLGFVVANVDDPFRPINSPKTKYQIDESILNLLRTYGTNEWEANLSLYLKSAPKLEALQVRERSMQLIPVTFPNGQEIKLSAGGQNELIKKIIEEFCTRFTPGGDVVYVGDAGNKVDDNELRYFDEIGIKIDPHGKMPDVVVDHREKNWLVLIEAVTSHGPIDVKRKNELTEIFKSSNKGLVFVTAFESRRSMNRFLKNIAWETEVWVAESPTHVIHFNGERFLGPYDE